MGMLRPSTENAMARSTTNQFINHPKLHTSLALTNYTIQHGPHLNSSDFQCYLTAETELTASLVHSPSRGAKCWCWTVLNPKQLHSTLKAYRTLPNQDGEVVGHIPCGINTSKKLPEYSSITRCSVVRGSYEISEPETLHFTHILQLPRFILVFLLLPVSTLCLRLSTLFRFSFSAEQRL